MPQQINLLDASLQRKRQTLGSVAGLIALVVTLGASAALALGLHAMSAQSLELAQITEQQLSTLQARVVAVGRVAPSRQAAELARLRSIESGQRRTRAALDSGQAGGTQGYSGYLLALSRQSQGRLWITGFSVAPDGHSLELDGRMTDPRQLPDYLRRLNGEPLFKGREFAQLSLKTIEPGATTGAAANSDPAYTEFALRAVPSSSASR
jgi:Tfp pilus assembly protein PilN